MFLASLDIQFAGASSIMLFVNLIYAVIALILGVIALKFIDKIFLKKLDLELEIKNGNISAAIFAASLVLFIAIVIVGALGK